MKYKYKKGFIFTTDAMMAMTLIVIAATIVFFQGTTRMSDRYLFEQTNFMAADGVSVISTLKFSDVNESERDLIIAETNLTAEDLDMNLVSVIGALWAEGTPSSLGHAESLTEEYIGALIPEGYSYGLYINDDVIYANPMNDYSVMSASRRMISGIHEGMPLKGTSARISISNILSKDTSSYIYFGGFVGQGNITVLFSLPGTIDNVTGVYMEMDVASNFTMSVNGDYAGYYGMNGMTPMYANNWTMDPAYYVLFNPGGNIIRINFTDNDLWNKYIGGGFIKISYNTSQMDTTLINLKNDEVSQRYLFPGVDGLFNIYSSFYVPGQLNNMSIGVHFRNNISNTTVFLEIGNATIFHTNETGDQTRTFTSAEIMSNLTASGLDYNFISKKTIPLRFGYYEGSFETESGYGYGDAVLITDVSGSMDWRMGFDDSTGGTPRTCTDPNLNATNTQRLSVAKCVDKDFVGAMLNASGNRIGLVSFSTSTEDTHELSDNKTSLESQINGYTPQSSTCICCGINSAIGLFTSVTSSLVDRKSEWKYTIDYPASEPPDDASANNWKDINYDDSAWGSGDAILGFENLSRTCKYRRMINISNKQADLTDYQVKLENNLIASWHFSENSGTTAGDSSGHGHNGTLRNDDTYTCVSGDCPTWTTGRIGSGLKFDGVNDFVEIPHSDSFVTKNGTVELWFNTSEVTQMRYGIFTKDSLNFDTGGQLSIFLRGNVGSPYVEARLQSPSADYYVDSIGSPAIAVGNWYHVTVTFGGGGLRLYLNGVQVDSNAYTGGTQGNYEPIAIGANSWRSGDLVILPLFDFFKGIIDEVRMYNRALSPTEVNKHYQDGIAGNYADEDYIYADSRYMDNTSTLEFDHWDDNDAATWVKIPFLQNNTNTTIYRYYGCEGLSSTSNGTATFEFFDDFDGTSLDASKWAYNQGSYTVSGSAFQGNGGNSIEWVKTSTYQTPASTVVEFRMKPDFSPADWESGIGIGVAGEGTASGFVDDSGTDKTIWIADTIWGTGLSDSNIARSDFNTYHTYGVIMANSANRKYMYDLTDGRSHSRTGTKSGYIWLITDSDSASRDTSYDLIYARKYASTEPTISSVGSQEEISKVFNYTADPLTAVNTNIADNGGDYYFRKHFTVDDPANLTDMNLYVLSDDNALVYINGHLVDNDTNEHIAEYWNRPMTIFDDDFESGIDKWTITQGSFGSEVLISSMCGYSSSSNSVVFQGNAATIVSEVMDLSSLENVTLTYWIRQGIDGGGCENPESGKNTIAEYYTSSGTWSALKTHQGAGNDPNTGEGKEYRYTIPSDGLHSQFMIRFRFTGGNGIPNDMWAIDNVKITQDILVNKSYLVAGDNVVAVKLNNDDDLSAKFDLELTTAEERKKAMLVMSDGDANYDCNMDPVPDYDGDSDTTDDPQDHAIQAACNARDIYDITTYAVSFGPSAGGQGTLRKIACWDCNANDWMTGTNSTYCPTYYESSNADELREIYLEIADSMINLLYSAQKIVVVGKPDSTLYTDSYIEYNYTPTADLEYGEISLTFDSLTFGETSGNPDVESPKNGSYWIPPDVAVVDAKATSYSSEFWTSKLNMKNASSGWVNVYNISAYNTELSKLGDPYVIYMPTEIIEQNQTNYVQIDTSSNTTGFTGGSPKGRVIYTLKIKGIASYGDISAKAEGCNWTVEQYNFKNVTIKIPSDYNGTKSCEFSSAQIVYDHDDSIDNAAVLLFKQLDVTGDNRIDIAIDRTNIDMRIIKVVDLPWMWGPAILKLQVWK